MKHTITTYIKRLSSLLLIGMVFYSCGTLPSISIPKSYTSKSQKGVIVGSIAFKNEKPIFNGYIFYYTGKGFENITASKIVRIDPEQAFKMKFKPDFFDGDKAVYLFSIQEPEGDYNFATMRIVNMGVATHSTVDIPIDISFNIEKGKVKYLGELYFDLNQSGIQFSDERVRDLNKLNEKFPDLKIE